MRRSDRSLTRRGLTLLEVMVALVILALVATSMLELFGGTIRGAERTRSWSQAVAYGEAGMEGTKLFDRDPPPAAAPFETLPGGYRRWIELRPAGRGMRRVTVVVVMPDGGRFELNRLVRTE